MQTNTMTQVINEMKGEQDNSQAIASYLSTKLVLDNRARLLLKDAAQQILRGETPSVNIKAIIDARPYLVN